MEPTDKPSQIDEQPAAARIESGVLVVDKPLRRSSMSVVAEVRRKACGVKTGHAGTLDPLATGVLVLALGKATKAIDKLMATRKKYRTRVDLSAFTTTDDSEGERTEVEVATPPTREEIVKTLERFTGDIQQRPPNFSAIKIGGKRAYKLARSGKPVEPEPRTVHCYVLDVIEYDWPFVKLEMETGKGFYVRSLARDLGVALGTGGHCVDLRRTAVGPFDESTAVAPDDLQKPLAPEHLMTVEQALTMVESAVT